MSSPSTMILFFMIPLLFTATATSISGGGAMTTAKTTAATRQLPSYPEFLENYILPWILHSTHLKAYTLDKDTGEFTINLHRNALQISLSDMIYFKCKSTIKGVMNKEMSNVTNLEGISAKVGSFWVDVKDIKWAISDSDNDERFGIGFSWRAYPTNYEKLLRDHQGFWSKVVGFVKEKIMKMQVNYQQEL